MDESLSLLYDDVVKQPTTLIELSNSELKRFKDNIMHLSGLHVHKHSTTNKSTLPLYSTVTYGSNINRRKKNVSFIDTSFVNYIDLRKTKKNFVMITANKNECLKAFKNIFVLDTCMSIILDTERKVKKYQSGIVVLMIAAVPRRKNHQLGQKLFDNDLYTQVKKCKTNIKESFDHFGTVGEVYAFGNKPNYKIVDYSSVSEFGNKTSKVLKRRVWINEISNNIDEKCADVVRDGMGNFETIIASIKLLVSPIINAAMKIQTKYEQEVVKEVKTSSSGFWNTMLNVNGATTQFHSEVDCTYTLITVPKQTFSFKRNIENLPSFLFQMTTSHHAMIELNEDVFIVYNGRFLIHCQHFVKEAIEKEQFFNISCYGNNTLFNHLRKTFRRLDDKK